MSDNKDMCDVCKRTGLAVYPVRYAVVPKDVQVPDLGPFSGQHVTSISLTQSKYALRQMRQGYLYVFHERGARGRFYWEVYSVGMDGQLWKLPDPASARVAAPEKSCARGGHTTSRQLYFVIEQPHRCGTVWVAFSQSAWSEETVRRYGGQGADASALRAKRMQAIQPAAWMTSPTPGPHSVPLTATLLEQVVEYAPTVPVALGEPLYLPCLRKALSVSSGDKGAWRQQRLTLCSSQYEWTMRQGTAEQVQARAQASSFADASMSASCPPMMLALWDGIGLVHEINGFRNDAQGRFLNYCDEQALKINALQWIDQARQAVQAEAHRRATFDHSPAVAGSTGWYSPQAVAAQRAKAATADERQYWDDLDWLGRNGVPPSYQRQLTQFRSVPASSHYQDVMRDARGYVAAQPRVRQERAEHIAQDTETGTEKGWEKYAEKLAGDTPGQPTPKKLEVFRTLYERLQQAKQALLDQRTADVAAWLEAPLWLDTLEDYAPDSLEDGLRFQSAIYGGIVGLKAHPAGVKVLETLIGRLDPEQRNSLVWRMVAGNQTEGKQALKLALARAEADKHKLLDGVHEGYDSFAEAMEKVKKFAEVWQKMSALANQVRPLNKAEKLLKDHGVDQAIAEVGDLVFKRFAVTNSIGNFVGESIVKAIFMAKVRMQDADIRELVVKQAQVEPAMRRRFMDEYQAQRERGASSPEAFRLANEAVAATEGATLLRERWSRVRVTEGVGVVGLVGLIEVFALIKLCLKKDKEGKDIAELWGATFSVAGATAEIALKPLEALRLERGARILKLIGGYCGSVAAGVGAALDFIDGKENWKKQEYSIASLYALKSIGGVISSGAFLLTALSASAPFLERTATRILGREVIFARLGWIAQGIGDVTAEVAGKAVVSTSAERIAAMTVGRWLLILAGWEVQVAIIGIQLLIWLFSDNDLQKAIEESVFGIEAKYKTNPDAIKQDQAFKKAMEAVGFGGN
ncbi:Fis family transcriptional regulator [Xanthomonas oryzae]|uniref:T6SS effector BTH_I2691 family protein n=1 Tax=Xanthomonas oryzae TaxID=347 RepID=UPI001035071C|nr:T6SS effector BTH_I2691 family protein [Xanthomonas oryzae]QBG94629.1 Fis family transcriptional regulator [Xanthomonas oryzae]